MVEQLCEVLVFGQDLFFLNFSASFCPYISLLSWHLVWACVSQIVKLAAVRISGMVERLQLSQQIRENVYCLFQQILNQRTSLFFNRHIDQIILCCFYGIAKVQLQKKKKKAIGFINFSSVIYYVVLIWFSLQISQLNLTFREIIYNYRKQPQCKPQVFRGVFIDWSSTRRNGVSNQILSYLAFWKFWPYKWFWNREPDRSMLISSHFTMKYSSPL